MNSLYNRGQSNNEFLSIAVERLRDFRMKLLGNRQPPEDRATDRGPAVPEAPASNFEQMMHRQFDERENLLAQIEREVLQLQEFFHKHEGDAASVIGRH